MLDKVKGIIDNILGRNANKDMDNDGKIESYKDEIKGVFSQFQTMSEKLDEVNEKLQYVVSEELIAQEAEEEMLKRLIEESNKRKEESLERVEKASKEIFANKKLQEKVDEFIK